MGQTIRLIELFAGYGSQALALKYLNIPFEHHFVCDFDEHAIKSYNEIHGTNYEKSDIKEIHASNLNITDRDKYKYLMTYSYPCTSLSMAGKRQGMNRGSGTASSLLWEVERLLKECGDNLPQYLMMENVPQAVSDLNKHNFLEWVEFLVKLGYNNYYQIMDAKDYGVPQHRERVIMVSILKSENKVFTFPPKKNTKPLFRDIMEKGPVDPKYYLSNETIERISKWKSYQNPLDHIVDPSRDVCPTITARGAGEDHAGMQLIFEDNEIIDYTSSEPFWREHGTTITPTLKTKNHLAVVESSWRPAEKSLITDTGDVKKYNYSDVVEPFKEGQTADLSFPGGYGHGGGRIYDTSPTLTASATSTIATKQMDQKIRKITPRESFRLMGVKDEDYEKLTCNDQQKYKQAGNSIVCDVIMGVFENLFLKECKRKSLF